ncbi:DUF4261 domain-containing protein [Faecalibacter bovis]|uniref:DUF4261 domain-containing protein n=2 Tax=Faecalibacter bovis TaxID=2898187 RepID=A0ABX7XGV4_9FLAO|nr:DUF4261 domain-containing protein [Faecalibacter bovis]
MGLFSFFKKEDKAEVNPASKSILGMVLLEENNSFKIKEFTDELQNKWKLKIDNIETSDEASVLVIQGYNIAIAVIPNKIPNNEVEQTAEYNYFWQNGVKESSKHKGHIIVSIMNAGKDPIQENILYCKLLSSVLNNSDSNGVYIGGRTLVLSKDFYQSNVELMSDQNLPIYNWIYIGIRNENGKNSVYTYGLKDFGKKEMEIINSKNSIEDISEMLYNLSHYVLAYNVNLKSGETIGLSAEQKIKITESKGKFLNEKTLKIEY